MKISIAMATYNGEMFLQEQLDSFAIQTRLPDELIVQDDGSTDRTILILQGFAAKAAFPVKIMVNPKRLGVTRNFERAMMRCSGDIIFLSDQDDIWKNTKIERMMNIFIENQDIVITICDALIFTSAISEAKTSMLENIKKGRSGDTDFVHGCCTAVRKTFLNIILPIPILENNKIGYDEYLHMMGRWASGRITKDNPLQYYRRHSENASSTNMYNDNISMLNKLAYYFNQYSKIKSGDKKREWLEFQNNIAKAVTARQTNKLPIKNKKALDRAAKTLETRSNLIRLPKSHRMYSIIKLLFDGDYNQFSGLKSAISDFAS